MNTENIEYRCSAACAHNCRTDTRTFSPCHLKNKGLKKDKYTRVCYGNKCGFYVDNTKGEKKMNDISGFAKLLGPAGELENCPWCEEKAELIHIVRKGGHCCYQNAYVQCKGCGLRTRDYIVDGYYGSTDTVMDAISTWNNAARYVKQKMEVNHE